jgi:hypothetical protein
MRTVKGVVKKQLMCSSHEPIVVDGLRIMFTAAFSGHARLA